MSPAFYVAGAIKHRHQLSVVLVSVHLPTRGQLLEMVHARHVERLAFRPRARRKNHRHQQLDQSETLRRHGIGCNCNPAYPSNPEPRRSRKHKLRWFHSRLPAVILASSPLGNPQGDEPNPQLAQLRSPSETLF